MNLRQRLESDLTPQQIKAAQYMVENEWVGIVEDAEKRTMEEIAAEVNVCRRTLYQWKSKREFADYLVHLSDSMFYALRPMANAATAKLIKGGPNGLASVKALDLYYKRWGLLTTVIDDKRDVDDTPRKSIEEIRKDIDELNDMINGK